MGGVGLNLVIEVAASPLLSFVGHESGLAVGGESAGPYVDLDFPSDESVNEVLRGRSLRWGVLNPRERGGFVCEEVVVLLEIVEVENVESDVFHESANHASAAFRNVGSTFVGETL